MCLPLKTQMVIASIESCKTLLPFDFDIKGKCEMFSYWIYLLVGVNRTGKTSFQRHLVNYLCDENRTNVKGHWDVNLRAPRRTLSLFVANRSYQEVAKGEHGSVERYFSSEIFSGKLRPNVVILSTHSDNVSMPDINEILISARRRCFNVAGVFFSNDTGAKQHEILTLNWDERLWVENPLVRESDLQKEKIDKQLKDRAIRFGDLLIHRSKCQ